MKDEDRRLDPRAHDPAGGSLAAQTIERIRTLIISGELSLGQKISELELGAYLGVSRSPVREALKRLATEGLVTILPQRGTFVFEPELREIEEIVQLRGLLEVGALRLLNQAQASDLAVRWRAIYARAAQVLTAGVAEFPALDHEFHMAIFETLANRPLLEYYRIATGRTQALRVRHVSTPERAARSHASHLGMIEALESGDLKRCALRLEAHIAQSLASLRTSTDVRFKSP